MQRVHAGHEAEPVDAIRGGFQVGHRGSRSCAAGAAERGEAKLAVRVASEKAELRCVNCDPLRIFNNAVGSITARVCRG